MKKFILSLLSALFFLASALSTQGATPCAAQIEQGAEQQPTVGGYACILSHDVFFYTETQEKSGLFLLPESYYVKILDVAPDFCKIEYLYDDTDVKKIVGYAKTSQLTFVSYVPKRPYLYQLFDVRYTISDAMSTSSVLDNLVITCAYYGDYTIGSQTYCYVLRGDEFGYVPKPADLTIERNGEYDEWLQSLTPAPKQDETPTSDQTPSSSPAQIALLVAVCLLVPILAAFLFRSPKNQPYEDE
jgi:hypothetical protein